jgi:hypothetical protein
MHLHNPSDNPPPTSLPLFFSIMARTSRDPFSPLSSSMKKKGGGQKKVAGRIQQHLPSRQRRRILLNCPTSMKVHRLISARPPLRVLSHHWSPTQGEILFAQLGKRFRSHPLMFILVMIHSSPLFGQTYPTLSPFDGNIQPLDHTSPPKHPPASFVAAAACAASPANTLEDEDEAFNDLVGEDTFGLDNFSYSSAEDNEDYDGNMEKTTRQIEYSDRNGVSHGRRQTNFIPGGPKPPKYNGMNNMEKAMAKQEYKREHKKITDGLRLKRLKDQNNNFDPEAFSGCLTLGLRTMVDVQNCWLEVNHTFPDKEILVLHVAKETNLQGINFVCTQSNLRDFKCTGPRFCVIARHSERQGWFVSVANIRECDEFGGDVRDVDAIPEKLTSAFWTKWVVPLILSIIIDSPAISNKSMRHALSAYGKEHLLTGSILQEARSDAKAQLFGIAAENIQYAEGMKLELEKDSHIVELMYTNRKVTLCNVEQLVVAEELFRLKSATNSTLDRDERRLFLSNWKKDNYALLVNQLGYKSQECTRFLHGVFFTPSYHAVLVEKGAVAGAISSQCDPRMLCKHGGNPGRLQG